MHSYVYTDSFSSFLVSQCFSFDKVRQNTKQVKDVKEHLAFVVSTYFSIATTINIGKKYQYSVIVYQFHFFEELDKKKINV